MFFISMFLVLMSWFNFSSVNIYDFDMMKYLNEAVLNSVLLNNFIYNNEYQGDIDWDLFIIDQIFIEKGINVIDS